MQFNSILFATTSAFLLNSPAMADIKLTNGDFSSGSTGWSELVGYANSTLYNTTGGVATAPADGSTRSLYQKVTPRLETAATVIFDVTVNTLASGAVKRDFDFRLVNGNAGNVTNTIGVMTNTAHHFILNGGGATLFTSAFAMTPGTTYTISLYLSGMDGTGGLPGKVSGSILNQTTMVATRFSATNANIEKFDGLTFCRGGSWGANHQNTIDNVTVVQESATDL
jgi:hypothetical protein